MKRTSFCFALLFLVLALNAAADSNLVKIGVILPLSGDNAGLGQPQLAAVKLFEKECAEGHYRHQYKLVIEDNQLTPRASAEAANKLIYIDHVDGIVSLFCDAGHVLAPMIKKHQIPHVNCVCSDDTIPDGVFNFSHWPLPAKECASFVDLIQKQGGKRVTIVSMRQPGCVALTRGTLDELKKRGMPAVDVQYFNPDERDFRVTGRQANEFARRISGGTDDVDAGHTVGFPSAVRATRARAASSAAATPGTLNRRTKPSTAGTRNSSVTSSA